MRSLVLATWLMTQVIALQSGTGVITGRILSPDGTPAAGVRVAAVPVAEGRGESGEVFARISETDSKGNYRLENLEAGRYYIRAGLVNYPTYYPGVTSRNEARIVTVARGSALAGIDFRTLRIAALKVSGRVVWDPRQPVLTSTFRVVLTRAGMDIADVRPAANGWFEFLKVSSGLYDVMVRGAGVSRRINVSDRDITDIVLEFPFRVEINARLIVEDNGPLPQDPTALLFTGRNLLGDLGRFGPDGSFKILLREDNYRVIPYIIPSGYFVRSIALGSTDLLKERLPVAARSPSEIVLTLGVMSR